MATDRELVKQVQNGKNEAYAELFRKYYQQIYRICISIVKNPQDAEELAQEMFVLAYLKVDQLHDPDKFFPWIKKMTYNRSRNLSQRKEDDLIPLSFAGTDKNSPSPEEEILRRELIDAIMEAIEALPSGDRNVVKARIDGLSHAEISMHFGITPRASLSRLYRARKKLADHLKGLYSIFGLPAMSSFRKIILGGVTIMKIGIRAKIIISIISALMLGFIAFQIVTHSPDAGSPGSSNHQQVKQTSSHQSAKSDTSQRDISKGQKSGTIENEIGIQDEKVGEALAWLDSLEDSSMSQSTTGNKQEKDAIGEREEIYNGMTREEVVAKLAEVDKEIYDNLYTWGYLYSEVMEITQGRKSCPPNTTVEEMWSEADRAFRYAARIRALKRHQYARALGLDPSEPFRPGGWAYELIKHTSRRLGHP